MNTKLPVFITLILISFVITSCGCNHNFGNWTEIAVPTCMTDGIEEGICSNKNCGETTTRKGADMLHGFCTEFCNLQMVFIPGGTFTMGSPEGTGENNERPQRQVTLTGFRMNKFPVTQELYEAVMGENPSRFNGENESELTYGEIQNKRPVEQIRWYNTIIFCNKLSVKEGLTPAYEMQTEANVNIWSTDIATWGDVPAGVDTRWNSVREIAGSTGYRLPTEAQWEYACRAGSVTNYHFGDREYELDDYAWHEYNANWISHQVGLKLPNPFGLYDIHGGIREWCWDWFWTYPNIDETDPTGHPSSNDGRVLRGGSWLNPPDNSRSAFRLWGALGGQVWGTNGFRIVLP